MVLGSDRSAKHAGESAGAGRPAVALRFGIGVAAAVAGTLLHDVVEFGRPALENTGVVTGVLLAGAFAWSAFPARRRLVRSAMLAFVSAFLVLGAFASVLPLPLWPFEPDQSLVHYAVHAVWAGALGVTISMLLRLPDREDRRA